ncbi:hypothetical protein C5E45_21270 [Nocardia nova]|uniref:Uncharacterized protein n=1 Tax=Nocardia nova TaxID=37330 RepID=A0A2S6ALY9_9NOCA|nr:hypothetical protein [Nocardia nova]PPJ32608.1 hypothetical protein C5E41_05760 [Nocardia nova]PPJ36251.1 hypothetical protein C5E45_21270 [Nocardia nova]
MTERDNRELFSHWAIVTTGASCGASCAHAGACPIAVWGPYPLREAEYVVTTIASSHNPHVVPFWTRGVELGDCGCTSTGSGTTATRSDDAKIISLQSNSRKRPR